MTRDDFKITRLDTNRVAPATPVDRYGFRDQIIRELTEHGKQTCLELLENLKKSGGEKLFGITIDEWKEVQRIGWEDQNQIMDNLNLMVKEGFNQEEYRAMARGRYCGAQSSLEPTREPCILTL
jgi:hypothetical protein